MYDQNKLLNLSKNEAMPIVESIINFSTLTSSTTKSTCTSRNDESSRKIILEIGSRKNQTNSQMSQTPPCEISKYDDDKNNNNNIDSPPKPPKTELRCNFCGKFFNHLGDHRKHRRSHTGERPYRCSICPRAFGQAGNLIRHSRLHTGERPFQCGVCERSFARSDKLSEHFDRCAKRKLKSSVDGVK